MLLLQVSRSVVDREQTGLSMHTLGDRMRPAVEAFIRGVYARHFGADLLHFAPTLVSLRDRQGVIAAAGYRSADTGRLFLETYLDAPIEQVLAAHQGTAPSRARVVEVGHLAGARAGEGLRLVRLLGPHLAAQGFHWVVCTLTEELRHLFKRLGVAPIVLGRADPAALGDHAQRWGRYYEHRPMVLAGHLPNALQQLAARTARSEAP
ncbi:MAG: thermostable hemolysin [Burkholderiaceae bacterium]|nr:thermostable hemolysin [Burkholderiaceae bacterium]